MSEVKGKLVSCDRCGKEHFLKLIGTKDLDGGYSRYDEFEDLPEDWLFLSQIGSLCPHCAGLFRAFIHKFNKSPSIAPSWDLQEGDKYWLDRIEIKESVEV